MVKLKLKETLPLKNNFHLEPNPEEKKDIQLDFSISDGFPYYIKNEKAVVESKKQEMPIQVH